MNSKNGDLRSLGALSRFSTPPENPLARAERQRLRSLGDPRDLASGTLRLALHLSADEADLLEALNPETLGHDDQAVRASYWRKFIDSPDSAPFRVHGRI